MDLFSNQFNHLNKKKLNEPLALKMRPRSLDQFIGQEHLLANNKFLIKMIEQDQLCSMIFYGPPGTGKTTLAKIIEHTTNASFSSINAALSSVKDIKTVLFELKYISNKRKILFIDEIHRFNKSQQDSLLSHVESGDIILIGATTENPYFQVNKALLSRSQIFEFKSLSLKNLTQIVQNWKIYFEQNFKKKVFISNDAMTHIIKQSNGDARVTLNSLEIILKYKNAYDLNNVNVNIDLQVTEHILQRKAIIYDKKGNQHYDVISAFIKSMRGSDSDAALFWLSKMLEAGEDPRFIFRRMVIFASEDVGMADSNAIQVVNACAYAFDYVGMPEGAYHLTHSCLYLASAPKSNSTKSYFKASELAKLIPVEVPSHLRDGFYKNQNNQGKVYLNPHDYPNHWVAQDYLPDNLKNECIYQPSEQGYEKLIYVRLKKIKEGNN